MLLYAGRIFSSISLLSLGILVLGLYGCSVDSDAFPAATPANVISVTKKLFPAVVRLDIAHPQLVDGRETNVHGIGSGVIFDDAGHILTNFHVAGRATEIYVTLYGKERVHGRLIGDDHWTDLAVVQMDMDELKTKGIGFSHAVFGDSSKLVPGQDVMAIGTPFGLARTLTIGTISNIERTLYPEKLNIDDYETGGYSNWIQMDVPINPGNSGGPLVDLAGHVVGINTRGGAQNLNFAVPINTAIPIIQAILATATVDRPGHFDRSDLGIDMKPMQDLESFYKLDLNHGVLVNSVANFSAAKKADLEPQDVLLAVNGEPTDVRFPEELAAAQQMIASLPVGSPVQLTIRRNEKILTLSAITNELKGAIGEQISVGSWGLDLREVTRAYANQKQLDKAGGLLITLVVPDTPAAKSELRIDDVIEAIDGKPVGDLTAFRSIQADTKAPEFLLTIRRGQARRSCLIRLSPATAAVR